MIMMTMEITSTSDYCKLILRLFCYVHALPMIYLLFKQSEWLGMQQLYPSPHSSFPHAADDKHVKYLYSSFVTRPFGNPCLTISKESL